MAGRPRTKERPPDGDRPRRKPNARYFFTRPDSIAPDHSPVGVPGLEFGHGIHFYLGAALARAESQIAINSLLARRPRLELASEDLEWKSIPVFRGLKSLPVCI